MANPIDNSNKIDKIDEKIISILNDYPEGLRVRNIIKILDLKGRTIYNHLEKLKSMKLLHNIYPLWKIPRKIWQSSDTQRILANSLKKDKSEQGHKIAWILPLITKPYWWNKRKDRLMKLKEWHFKKEVTARNNIYFQIQNDYIQIQTFKNSIYFICQKEYFGKMPIEIFNESKEDVLEAIRFLEEQFRFKFIAEGNFHLTLVDNHYVTIRDALSEYYKKINDKFEIITKDGYKLYVDFSEPLGIESNNIEVKRRYLRHYKDIVDNPELSLPSEMDKKIKEIDYGLNELADRTVKMSKGNIGLSQVLEQMNNNILKLTKEVAELKFRNN